MTKYILKEIAQRIIQGKRSKIIIELNKKYSKKTADNEKHLNRFDRIIRIQQMECALRKLNLNRSN